MSCFAQRCFDLTSDFRSFSPHQQFFFFVSSDISFCPLRSHFLRFRSFSFLGNSWTPVDVRPRHKTTEVRRISSKNIYIHLKKTRRKKRKRTKWPWALALTEAKKLSAPAVYSFPSELGKTSFYSNLPNWTVCFSSSSEFQRTLIGLRGFRADLVTVVAFRAPLLMNAKKKRKETRMKYEKNLGTPAELGDNKWRCGSIGSHQPKRITISEPSGVSLVPAPVQPFHCIN